MCPNWYHRPLLLPWGPLDMLAHVNLVLAGLPCRHPYRAPPVGMVLLFQGRDRVSLVLTVLSPRHPTLDDSCVPLHPDCLHPKGSCVCCLHSGLWSSLHLCPLRWEAPGRQVAAERLAPTDRMMTCVVTSVVEPGGLLLDISPSVSGFICGHQARQWECSDICPRGS